MNRAAKHLKLNILGGLQFQLVGSLLVVLITVIIIGYLVQSSISLEIIRSQREKDTVEAFGQTEISINAFLDSINRSSIDLAVDAAVTNFANADFSDQLALVKTQMDLGRKIDNILFADDRLYSGIVFLSNGRYGGSSIPNTFFRYDGNDTKKHPFYQTSMYAYAMENKGSSIWVGGYTKELFTGHSAQNVSGYSDNDRIIMNIRSFFPANNSKAVVLVTSVWERSLRKLYSKLAGENNSVVMILDSSGRIISGEDTRQYGKNVPYFNFINPGETYGSFINGKGGDARQIVYYHLPNPNWIIIKDIPLQLYERDIAHLQKTMIALSIASIVIILLIYSLWMNRFIHPITGLTAMMQVVGRGNLKVRAKMNGNSREMKILIQQFNAMLDDLNKQIQKIESMEQDKRMLEIEALQAQINPHFIYNTITTIRWMAIMVNAQNVSNALVAFINVLRPVFGNYGITWTLEQEIEFTKNYFNIMNCRFGGSIVFNLEVNFSRLEICIPRFILQPLVENAISHGFVGVSHGVIHITIHQRDDFLILSVKDNGLGIKPEQLERIRSLLLDIGQDMQRPTQSIGLYNVNKRIQLHYGKEYGLYLESQMGKGTVTTIRLPVEAIK